MLVQLTLRKRNWLQFIFLDLVKYLTISTFNDISQHILRVKTFHVFKKINSFLFLFVLMELTIFTLRNFLLFLKYFMIRNKYLTNLIS